MYEIYCELRDEKGYKDSDVARITGITKSTFSDWKSGRSTPKQDKLQKIADCFNVSLDYLATGKENSETYEILAKLLEERNLKAADVCRGTGLPSSLFSEWKRGKSTPKADKLQKIADYFGVSLEYLMTGNEKESSVQPESELSNVYFSLAREAQENGIDPRDIKMAIEMLKKIREEEKK